MLSQHFMALKRVMRKVKAGADLKEVSDPHLRDNSLLIVGDRVDSLFEFWREADVS